MNIDEAIKHCEEVAQEKQSEARDLEYSKLDWRHEANQCSERAEEYRQIAEWLKDYKRLKEQEPCDDTISRRAVLKIYDEWFSSCNIADKKESPKAQINALPPVTPQPCEDCISRKAVLDYIYNDLGLGDEENGKDVERQMELESSYKYVKSLPPVNPQPKTGH